MLSFLYFFLSLIFMNANQLSLQSQLIGFGYMDLFTLLGPKPMSLVTSFTIMSSIFLNELGYVYSDQ